MTAAPLYEAPASDSVLLTFDGRVLEVFGYVDAARYHVWEGPRMEFGTGRFRRVVITVRSGRRQSVPYDADRRAGLEELAAVLARSVPERPGP
ncbi:MULTISPECIES: hypothetical protein [Streptomyces]|uniref:Uncharacterized protein n=2 Tax=Streptomyces TaxID=1883 RepID=A0A0W7X7Q1_9ACTN|nr:MULTISPECIES: hypothetical protein [Streptomyces]KUF19001.1 hypothetical protein AT728_08325 [Streptomyces silvensis]MVO89449.1 hypothetical protein [Streptomyces typhae]